MPCAPDNTVIVDADELDVIVVIVSVVVVDSVGSLSIMPDPTSPLITPAVGVAVVWVRVVCVDLVVAGVPGLAFDVVGELGVVVVVGIVGIGVGGRVVVVPGGFEVAVVIGAVVGTLVVGVARGGDGAGVGGTVGSGNE